MSQESFKSPAPGADGPHVDEAMKLEIVASMEQLIDQVIDGIPGVTGGLVSSVDGFALASRLPDGTDEASVAAMSSALLGLSSRLAQSVGREPVRVGQLRSGDTQVFVFAAAHAATFTIFADPSADGRRVAAVGREVALGLTRLFRGTVDV